MMGKITSDAVDSLYSSSNAEECGHGVNKDFNNLLDAYLSDGLSEDEERKIGTGNSLALDDERTTDILLRALIFGAAQLEENTNEKGQQKIKEILGELPNKEIKFASQKLEKVSASSAEQTELPTILPNMEEIDTFLEEGMLSKAS